MGDAVEDSDRRRARPLVTHDGFELPSNVEVTGTGEAVRDDGGLQSDNGLTVPLRLGDL